MILAFLLVVILILMGIIYLFFKPDFDIQSKHHLITNKKIIALTFDDGPEPNITPKILDILKKYNIKATFFVVGKNAKDYSDVLKRIYKEGHLVANHSYKHNYQMFNFPSKILKDAELTNELIYKAIGKYPVFYRPPFGLRTTWGAKVLNKNGFKIITWDNMTNDYWNINPKKLFKKITSKARKGGIIVLHDGSEGFSIKNRTNIVDDGLENIIKYLKSKNFQFISLNEMFNVDGYK